MSIVQEMLQRLQGSRHHASQHASQHGTRRQTQSAERAPKAQVAPAQRAPNLKSKASWGKAAGQGKPAGTPSGAQTKTQTSKKRNVDPVEITALRQQQRQRTQKLMEGLPTPEEAAKRRAMLGKLPEDITDVQLRRRVKMVPDAYSPLSADEAYEAAPKLWEEIDMLLEAQGRAYDEKLIHRATLWAMRGLSLTLSLRRASMQK